MSLTKLDTPKRGFLAQILTIPPLIYPFQYNPTQVSDTKTNKYRPKTPSIPPKPGIGGALGATASLAGGLSGGVGAIATGLKDLRQALGQTFSKAPLLEFDQENARVIGLKFVIDGREKRPGEPDRRRDDSGSILGDLAIIRSFVYPQLGDIMEIVATAADSTAGWGKAFFNKPPSCVLVLGGTSVEGFVTDLKITETLFNKDLDPMRAEVELQMQENTDSISFIIDSFKRIGRTFYNTAYEDIGKVLF